MSINVHTFDNPEFAYTSVNCDDWIADGDVIVSDTGEVGFVYHRAWVVAVTEQHGGWDRVTDWPEFWSDDSNSVYRESFDKARAEATSRGFNIHKEEA
jgi:hypothetical protein